MHTQEGCASISDFNGNLLFYTDGITVYNRNHGIMPNGTGLKGDFSSTQSAIIVPRPGSSTIFYIFTVDDWGNSDGLQYSELDMTLDGGLGDITATKNIQLATPVAEKLTAVEHANGVDIWVLAHDRWSDTYRAYLVTAAGVTTTSVNSNVGHNQNGDFLPQNAFGAIKASPNGSKIASCFFWKLVELYDFDNATGQLSNPRILSSDTSKGYYGVEFAADSRMLYVTDFHGELFQYDTDAPDVMASELSIFQDLGIQIGSLQLALDGKIYMAHNFESYLSVIDQPEVPGSGCGFALAGVDLNGRLSQLGLPPFIQSFFQVAFTAENLCSGSPTDFELTTSETVLSVLWDFGDGNTSTIENPSHTYTSGGAYTVSATVTTASGTKTETEEIMIYATPVANTAADFEVCSLVANVEFDLSTKTSEILGIQLPADYQVTYHATLTDAENETNVLPVLYTNSLPTETIYVRIHNILNPDCFDTTSFDIRVKGAPQFYQAIDWTVCDTDTDGFYDFDLSQKDVEIFNGQDTGTFSVAYFETQAHADADANAIGPIYTNTTSPQTIFYRIDNSVYPECYETGSFVLEVITDVTANTPVDLEVCDDDNDGFYTFDLSVAETEILGTQNPASLAISYHSALADAESKVNPHPVNYTNTVAHSETVYVRVENTSDPSCYDTTSFELLVNDSPVQQMVIDWQVCDPDGDGTFTFDLTQKDSEVLGSQSATDFSVSYHLSQAEADADQNAIVGNFDNTQNRQPIFYRLESGANADCYLSGSFQLEVFDMPVAHSPADMIVCAADQTGSYVFDFSQKDVELLNGQDASQYSVTYFGSQTDAQANSNALPKNDYVNTLPQETIYARVHHINLDDCFDIANFSIRINPLPQPNLEEIYIICPDSPDLEIDGGNFESWSWKNDTGQEIGNRQMVQIATLGNYSLTVSLSANSLTCEETVYFEVVSSGAPEDFTYELGGFSDVIYVDIDVTGTGEFEYSADGQNFQPGNRLQVFPGKHTIYVRDIYECRTLSKEIIALGYQKFFTPNGDGANDRWHIIAVEHFPESLTYIYDRYGKMMAQLSPTGPGWDGTYQGISVPSTDYWFRFTNVDGTEFSGHFSLKR